MNTNFKLCSQQSINNELITIYDSDVSSNSSDDNEIKISSLNLLQNKKAEQFLFSKNEELTNNIDLTLKNLECNNNEDIYSSDRIKSYNDGNNLEKCDDLNDVSLNFNEFALCDPSFISLPDSLAIECFNDKLEFSKSYLDILYDDKFDDLFAAADNNITTSEKNVFRINNDNNILLSKNCPSNCGVKQIYEDDNDDDELNVPNSFFTSSPSSGASNEELNTTAVFLKENNYIKNDSTFLNEFDQISQLDELELSNCNDSKNSDSIDNFEYFSKLSEPNNIVKNSPINILSSISNIFDINESNLKNVITSQSNMKHIFKSDAGKLICKSSSLVKSNELQNKTQIALENINIIDNNLKLGKETEILPHIINTSIVLDLKNYECNYFYKKDDSNISEVHNIDLCSKKKKVPTATLR